MSKLMLAGIRMLLCSLLAATALTPVPAHAQTSLTPVRRALILSRIVAYDKNLAVAGQPLTVAVVTKAAKAAANSDADELAAAFQKVAAETKVGGSELRAVRLTYTDLASFEAALSKLGVKAVYLAEGLDGDLEAITRLTRGRKILSLCGQEATVRAGVSVGVYVDESKTRMIVNLAATQAEGVTFPPELLRLAEVVR